MKNFDYSNSSKPSYQVEWSESNIYDLEFAQTDLQKLMVAKYLIQLMNEVDPLYLNFHNYWVIAEWYQRHDIAIQLIFNDIDRETQSNKSNSIYNRILSKDT